MFRQYLEGISGIGIYPLFSLIVFFLFFTGMFIWAVRADKDYLTKMSHVPINDDEK
jgi:cytochrome c oxidase cbb3-type subunit 3